jgi:hypothetical protein
MSDPHGELYPDDGATPEDHVTPQPPRRRGRALAVGIVAAALVIGGAVATVAILATGDKSKPAAATAASSAAPAPVQATSAEPSPTASPERVGFTFPAKIGSLTNKTRPDSENLRQNLTRLGVADAFYEQYEDFKGRTVILYGGNVGTSGYADKNADQVLDDILKAATDPAKGRTAGARRSVPTGRSGGMLACAPVKDLGTACGWKLDDRYLEAVLVGWQLDAATALVPTVLDTVVVPG